MVRRLALEVFMSLLKKFDELVPFRKDLFFPLEQEFNKLFNDLFNKDTLNTIKGSSGYPKLDVYADNGKFFVKVAVPGVNPDDLKVEISPENILSISGKHESSIENANLYITELRRSEFKRELKLPDWVETDPVAEVKNGILTLSWDLPEIPQKNTRSIEIKKT